MTRTGRAVTPVRHPRRRMNLQAFYGGFSCCIAAASLTPWFAALQPWFPLYARVHTPHTGILRYIWVTPHHTTPLHTGARLHTRVLLPQAVLPRCLPPLPHALHGCNTTRPRALRYTACTPHFCGSLHTLPFTRFTPHTAQRSVRFTFPPHTLHHRWRHCCTRSWLRLTPPPHYRTRVDRHRSDTRTPHCWDAFPSDCITCRRTPYPALIPAVLRCARLSTFMPLVSRFVVAVRLRSCSLVCWTLLYLVRHPGGGTRFRSYRGYIIKHRTDFPFPGLTVRSGVTCSWILPANRVPGGCGCI